MYCKEPMSDELLIIMNCFFFLLNSTALLLSRWQSSDELNWCVLPRAKFNGNCTISSKHTKWVDFLSLSLRLSAVLFPKLSRVARISFYFKWFSKVFWKNLFPNVSTYRGCGGGRGGKWMFRIKLCQVPNELSFWLGSALWAPASCLSRLHHSLVPETLFL